MIILGIIAALVVIYALFLPAETSRQYKEYCRIENRVENYRSNRSCYLQHR